MFLVEEFDYRYGGSIGRYYYKNIENARKKFYEILTNYFEDFQYELDDLIEESEGEDTLEDILEWHFSEQGYYESVVSVEEIKVLDE
jgi:hypothetical protein